MHEHLYKCLVEEIQKTTNEVSERNEKQVRRYKQHVGAHKKQQAQNNMHMGKQIIVHIEEDGKSGVASRKSVVVAMMSS
jgi:hypothetical protein